MKGRLTSAEQLVASRPRPRQPDEPVAYLGIAWYADGDDWRVCGIVLEREMGVVRTTGEPTRASPPRW